MSGNGRRQRGEGVFGIYQRVLALISPERRGRFFLLVGSMVAMAICDLIGVAAILPFLSVLANSDRAAHGLTGKVYDALGFNAVQDFLIFLGLAVFALVMLSIIVRAGVHFLMVLFIRRTTQQLALGLLDRYLQRPYEWYLGRNSAEIGKSLLAEALYVVNNAIAPAVRLIANCLVTGALIALLLLVEPVGVLVGGGLIALSFAFVHYGLGPVLDRAGRGRLEASEDRFQVTNEAMGGIKEIKLRGLERRVIERFRGPSDRIAKHQASISLISSIPHYLIEALCFGAMLAFLLYLLFSGGGAIEAVLPIVGIFAFAGIKLMPLVKEIFTDSTLLRANAATLASLQADLESLPPSRFSSAVVPLPLKRELTVENVSYAYPDAKQPTLKGVSITVPAGHCVGVVGATGAGKTTLIDLILGLLLPQDGRITVDGAPITDENRLQWQKSIGYVPQSIFLSDSTIAANIAFGLAPEEIDIEKVKNAAKLAALDDFASSLPDGYQTSVGEGGVRLSGGQRQRIGIARALYLDPDLIVFDEGTSALDTVTEREVVEAVTRLHGRKTVVLITHRLSTVRNCDTIFILNAGEVEAFGGYEDLSAKSEVFGRLIEAM